MLPRGDKHAALTNLPYGTHPENIGAEIEDLEDNIEFRLERLPKLDGELVKTRRGQKKEGQTGRLAKERGQTGKGTLRGTLGAKVPQCTDTDIG